MHVELNDDELARLRRSLERDLRSLQDEVAHTEAHVLQAELAREIEGLERLERKLRPISGSDVAGAPI